MRRMLGWILTALAALTGTTPGAARAASERPFTWNDGDRVVMVGDTLIERDQKYGYFETIVTARNPGKRIAFRNLGWSGDTVRGLSRARFGPPAEGWQHLVDHIVALKPTVLILGYGMADSFDGEPGLPAFVSGLNALIDAAAASRPRLVLLSPIAHEDLGRPLPDASKHNRSLEKYRDAVRTVARERGAWFVDLYDATRPGAGKPTPLTDDGIHPTALGYWFLGALIDQRLSGRAGPPGAIAPEPANPEWKGARRATAAGSRWPPARICRRPRPPGGRAPRGRQPAWRGRRPCCASPACRRVSTR